MVAWTYIPFRSSNIIEKSAISSLVTADNKLIICGGFYGKDTQYEKIYSVKIVENGEWEFKERKETLGEKICFINSNFLLGDNGNYYACAFSGKFFRYTAITGCLNPS